MVGILYEQAMQCRRGKPVGLDVYRKGGEKKGMEKRLKMM